MKISKGCLVSLRFQAFDPEGELLDPEGEVSELEYLHGAEELPRGFERGLSGRSSGEKFEITVSPEDGYGKVDPTQLISIPRDELPPDLDVHPGDLLPILMQPEDGDEEAEAEEVEVPVVDVDEDGVVVDLNHPLAGITITFKGEVLSVQTPGDA